MSAPEPASSNPYPGLRPFHEGEEYLFFGRENQVDRMVDKLTRNRFLAVVGTSGSGKSSLVNCGLRPALHRGLMAKAGTCWRIAQFRPGGHPLRAMARALAAEGVLFTKYESEGLALEEIVETTLQMSNLGLVDIYEQAQLKPDVNLLVVVDQFEELFRFNQNARQHSAGQEAAALVNLLLEAHAQTTHPIYVVLTMRSDFLGDCSQFNGLPEAINEGQYLVPRLTREELRAAVSGPAAVSRSEVSPLLLTRVVNDVGANPDQLSILQHALNRTWALWHHRTKGAGALSLEDYENIGSMVHALDRHAEKAHGELTNDRQRLICERVFKTLTDKGTDPRGVRRPATLAALCEITGSSDQEIIEVIDIFRKRSRSFLMPPLGEAVERDTVIDISHESLMRVWERLNRWADEEAASSNMYRRLGETAGLHASGNAALWGDPELQLALEWRRKQAPTAAWADLYRSGFDKAMAFLAASERVRNAELAEVELEHRWRRPHAAIVIVLAAVLIYFLRFETDVSEALHHMLSAFIPEASGPDVRESLRQGLRESIEAALKMALYLTPLALMYLGLVTFGKRLYRSHEWEKIVAAVAASRAEPATPAQAAANPVVLRYAAFGRRAAAEIIDLVIFIVVAFTSLIMGLEMGHFLGNAVLFLIVLTPMALSAGYDSLLVGSRWQATLGKKAMGLVVCDEEGRKLTRKRAAARHFAKLLSYVLVLLGFLLQPFTQKMQALHDLIVRSVVLLHPKLRQGSAQPHFARSAGE